ncbi:MAG: hypothetical protein ACOCTI_00650, partial [Phycisphaeraceae bacterium]
AASEKKRLHCRSCLTTKAPRAPRGKRVKTTKARRARREEEVLATDGHRETQIREKDGKRQRKRRKEWESGAESAAGDALIFFRTLLSSVFILLCMEPSSSIM